MFSEGSGAPAMASLLIAGSLLGCSEPTNINCPDRATWAIQLTVEDAESGSPVDSALAVATDEPYNDGPHYADSAFSRGDPASHALLAYERAGIYDVSVEKEGYATWKKTAVRVVRKGHCETLFPVSFTARLDPLSH